MDMKPGDEVIVLCTGGGSGGHVYPLLAVGEELRRLALEQHLTLDLEYFGPRDEYAEILRTAGFGIKGLSSAKLRRYFTLENFFDIPKFFIGLIDALFKVYMLMPDVIFSKGGTGALPVVIAGWFYGIPIMIHESDAVPGLTNLLSARFATRIATSFEVATKYFSAKKTAWIGTPIRKDLSNPPAKAAAKADLGFDPKIPLTLVLGGSLGSTRVNEFILSNLANLLKVTQVFHQTGQGNMHEVERLSRAALTDLSLADAVKSRYRPIGYLDKSTLVQAYAAADVVVARAGSGSIFEIAALGKPAILIPLRESANDHQRVNAYEFSKLGAAIVIEEENLLPGVFLTQLKSILDNPETMSKMGVAAANFFRPGAETAIAEEILRLV